MVDELLTAVARSDEWSGDDVPDILTTYLRDPLLKHKLHDRFHAMMKGVVDIRNAAGDEPSARMWFDYGLACHFKAQPDAAAAAYRACLAEEPEHTSAQKNLMMVLSPKARNAFAIEQAIRATPNSSPPSSVADLTLEQAVYLLALYRACGGAEQDLTLRPFGDNEHPFAPTEESRRPLIKLINAGLVKISDQSQEEAFVVDQSTLRVSAYVLGQLYWEIPAATMELIREIEEACLTNQWPESWRDQAPALAHELARYECLAYLRECADERKLIMPSGEKTMLMIDNLLTTFSVAQAYAFFWRGAVAAADFKQREDVTAAHAGNTIVGNCQRSADRARAEGWEIKPYSRPKSVRRSELSYTLHDAFLGFGERAFTLPIEQLFEPTLSGPAVRGSFARAK